MQDNSTDNTTEMLMKYIDGELSTTEKEATEKLLREDASLQERYQYFVTAKKAIKSEGLKQRVHAIHREYMQEAPSEPVQTTTVVPSTSFFTTFMRIAAVFIVVIAGYGVVQYTSTTSQSVYNDNFVAYQLPVNRSSETTADLDALYQSGNYIGVIAAFNATEPKNQKAYFLAAQAYLQVNNPTAAIAAFKEVENINNKNADQYFVQETDYYLLLAYIKAGNIDSAEQQLSKITSNKQHLFYNKANDISRTKLMMLKWKNK